MACRDPYLLLRESQFWHNRHSKKVGQHTLFQFYTSASIHCEESTRSPDFRHRQTKLPGRHNPQKEMRVRAAEFDAIRALMDSIKDCGKQKDLDRGSRIHADILKTGLLKRDIYIGTALVRMFARCGALAQSQEVFNGLPVRDAASWNALIAGYAQHGLAEEALNCLGRMRDEGFSPDAVTFVCILKACSSIGALQKGEEIHAEVRRLGLLENHNILLSTALVDMYIKCGALVKAQQVFDGLLIRDAVSWTALIAGYAQHGLGKEALNCFGWMQDEGFSPDATTFICILKACGTVGATEKGEEIHAEVQRRGLLENHDIVLGTALVDMYAKCGALAKAQQVFDGLLVRNAVTWTVLIAGYVQHGLGEEALNCFERMRDEGTLPDAATFVCILKACGSIGAAKRGEAIHAQACRMGLLENHHLVLGTALVDMYAKCGVLAKAQEVFDALPVRDAVSWTVLITGYAQHGLGEEALKRFEQMRDEGFFPDAAAFICILKACASIEATKKGEAIHAELRSLGLLESDDLMLGTALVDMYGKCGALAKAQRVFDGLPVKNAVCWNALIAGYVQHGYGEEALNCFERMRDEGFSPNTSTFVGILKACGSIGATEEGEQIHAEIRRLGLLEDHNIMLGTVLLDMYVKCGVLAKAQEVFDELPVRDAVSWTALMSGYARLDRAQKVFDLFSKMRGECIEPDGATFSVLLTACSHAGLVEEGQKYFDIMSSVYSIIPTLEHHASLVELFSRAGHFDKAISVIKRVPDSDLWLVLSDSCQNCGNVELGKWAFEQALQLGDKCAAAYYYVCMSNIYAAAGMQEEADKVEALRTKNGKWKMPGRCWWTDVGGAVHSFMVGDKGHPQSNRLYAKLKDIHKNLRLEGYSPHLHWVLQAMPDDGKEYMVCGRCEKFPTVHAIASLQEQVQQLI